MKIRENRAFKEYEAVEVLVEKERYTKHGVHKGMQGWICHDERVEGMWLVNFPQYGDHEDIATTSVHEDDLKIISDWNAWINERIRAEHESKS